MEKQLGWLRAEANLLKYATELATLKLKGIVLQTATLAQGF